MYMCQRLPHQEAPAFAGLAPLPRKQCEVTRRRATSHCFRGKDPKPTRWLAAWKGCCGGAGLLCAGSANLKQKSHSRFVGDDRRPQILSTCRASASKPPLGFCWVSLFQLDSDIDWPVGPLMQVEMHHGAHLLQERCRLAVLWLKGPPVGYPAMPQAFPKPKHQPKLAPV